MTEAQEKQTAHRPRSRIILLATLLALLYGIGLYAVMQFTDPGFGLLKVAFLFGVPFAAPSLAIIIVDSHGELDSGKHVGMGLTIVTAMLIAGIAFLREGGICVLMAAPIFYLTGTLGPVLTGLLLRRAAMRRLSRCLVFLPIAVLPIDNPANYPATDEIVTSAIEIDAPASAVWRNLTEVRNIQRNELRWTFTQDLVGVPKPENAELAGHGVGAIRHVTWGKGIHFDERVTKWEENRLLAWDFHFNPDSIPHEIEGHVKLNSPYLKVENGSYRLTPLSPDQTLVTLTTHYWMRTAINPYCAWWGRIFIRDFHSNVLNVIRERAERFPAQT